MNQKFFATAVFVYLVGSMSAYASAGCPNFVGTYQSQDPTSPVTLTVTQTGCTSVETDYLEPNGEVLGKIYPLDNVRRETYQSATLLVYETSGIEGVALQNVVEDFTIAINSTITSISQFYLDANGNLISAEKDYDQNGKLYHTNSNQFNRVQQ